MRDDEKYILRGRRELQKAAAAAAFNRIQNNGWESAAAIAVLIAVVVRSS